MPASSSAIHTLERSPGHVVNAGATATAWFRYPAGVGPSRRKVTIRAYIGGSFGFGPTGAVARRTYETAPPVRIRRSLHSAEHAGACRHRAQVLLECRGGDGNVTSRQWSPSASRTGWLWRPPRRWWVGSGNGTSCLPG